MKNIFIWMAVIAFGCKEQEKKKAELIEQQTQPAYTKDDLGKIKWIEGKWKGLYKGQPFYEIYRFSNDSTVEITSFEWDGKDSSKTTMSYLYYKEGSYYLGEKQNYKTTSITDKEIKMVPNVEAYNHILWKYRDSTGWDAILTGSKETQVYNMQYFDPFKK